jgi:hypothetical protein
MNATQLASAAGFEVGSHHIALNIDGRQFDFNFNVSATDTVREVQQRIANAVNNRNIGVTASVDRDSAAGTSALVFQSRESGVANEGQPNFTVSSNAGNALAVTGVANVTQAAQNAQFRVNRNDITGALRTSRTNEVDLGSGVTANLRATGNVEVSMSRDDIRQINAFRHMVNSFNDLMSSAREAAGSRGSQLERELSDLARSASASLNRVGISVNQDGFMRIDEDRMSAAAQRGELERFATRDRVGSGQGFMNRLTRTADRVSRNPEAFFSGNNNPAGPSGPWSNFNPRQASQMNRLMNLGMLFETSM